jgi:hypothetical protein
MARTLGSRITHWPDAVLVIPPLIVDQLWRKRSNDDVTTEFRPHNFADREDASLTMRNRMSSWGSGVGPAFITKCIQRRAQN